jgi:hypothetical protein
MTDTSLARPNRRPLSSPLFVSWMTASIVILLAAGTVHASPQAEGTSEAAVSDAEKAAEDMARTRADLLAKHQGADEARLTQLMGPPSEKGTRDAELTLIWRGPAGGGDPLPCRLSATLVEGGLANIELSGHPSWDKKTCRKFLRPLLQAMPWKSIEHPAPASGGARAASVLTNDAIVQMVKEGLPIQAIFGRIRTQPCRFDVSDEGMSVLRRNHVPEVLIESMSDRRCA